MRARRGGSIALVSLALVFVVACTAADVDGDAAGSGVAQTDAPEASRAPVDGPTEATPDAEPSAVPSPGATATERGTAAGRQECAAIADDLVVALQAAVDEAGDAPLSAVLEGEALSAETRARLEELQARATAAECSQRTLADLLRERADRIEGDELLARLLRSALRAGEELPL